MVYIIKCLVVIHEGSTCHFFVIKGLYRYIISKFQESMLRTQLLI